MSALSFHSPYLLAGAALLVGLWAAWYLPKLFGSRGDGRSAFRFPSVSPFKEIGGGQAVLPFKLLKAARLAVLILWPSPWDAHRAVKSTRRSAPKASILSSRLIPPAVWKRSTWTPISPWPSGVTGSRLSKMSYKISWKHDRTTRWAWSSSVQKRIPNAR